MTKKKVLFVLYDLGPGGAQKVLSNMASLMDGYDVTVKVLMGNGDFEKKFPKKVHIKSLVRVKNKVLRKILSGLFQYVIPQKWVYRMFYKGDFDYEVAFMEGYPVKLLSHSDSFAKKYAWTHIDMIAYTKQDRLFRSKDEQADAYSKFNKVFSVSAGVADALNEKLGVRSDVFVNIYDDRRIRKMAGERQDHDCFTVITCCNLIERKRVDRAIEIMRALKEAGENIKFTIVGSGPEEMALRELVSRWDLGDSVTFTDYTDNPYKYIVSSDLYLCTSESEGMSTAAIESLILGTPVITTPVSGTEEIFGGKGFDPENTFKLGGFVQNDVAVTAAIISSLSEDRERYGILRKNALKNGERFTMESRRHDIERIFQ